MKKALKAVLYTVLTLALLAVIAVFTPQTGIMRTFTPEVTPELLEIPPVALMHAARAGAVERGVTERTKSRVTIAVGGDVLPSGRIGAKIADGLYEDVLDPVTAERLRGADVTLINLESSVSERGTPIPDKQYTFRSAPESLLFLTDYLGVDVVSLANNHTPDYGWNAFEDTLTHTRDCGIATIGAGMNLAEAAEPYIANVGGLRIAFFAANQVVSYPDWPAGANKRGQLTHYDGADLGALDDAMLAIRDSVDYIVVYLHWGIERDNNPSARQSRTAKALIEAGADIIIGAHPHVIQAFGYMDGVPIAYSVGNFLFNSLNPETCVLFISIEDGEIEFEILPCLVSGTLTYAAEGEKAESMLAKWSGWSQAHGAAVGADGVVSKLTNGEQPG